MHTKRNISGAPIATSISIFRQPSRALHNPSIPLTWVEGEKKALKGTQEGLSCIGLGGLWNFPMDGKPLPDLDAIAYAHR